MAQKIQERTSGLKLCMDKINEAVDGIAAAVHLPAQQTERWH